MLDATDSDKYIHVVGSNCLANLLSVPTVPCAGAAARTKTAFLAAERHQVLDVAGIAAYPQTNTSGTCLNSRRLAPKGWKAGRPE
jgi:hypothetical protein